VIGAGTAAVQPEAVSGNTVEFSGSGTRNVPVLDHIIV
jgi:hypothetical protein